MVDDLKVVASTVTMKSQAQGGSASKGKKDAGKGASKAKEELKEEKEEEPEEGEASFGEKSVLQAKLSKLAVQIGYGGTVAALLSLIVLVSRFVITTYIEMEETFHVSHISKCVQYFITAITILVVAVPEGLPLAVTISLAYSVKVNISYRRHGHFQFKLLLLD